ncbi:peptidoglycan-associated lipoprotein Pal [beta proteobacterium MWH-UniP1]
MQQLLNKFSRLPLVLSSVAIVALAGCASQVPLDDKQSSAPVSTAGASGSSGSSAADAAMSAAERQIAAAKAALSQVKPSVYFDFDKYEIKPEFQNTVTAFANYMKADAKARLVIEGNADERGTTEYNLALGQKRAEAVSKALGVMGVGAGRVEAISNGEEKPRAKGSNEAAWAENRRADLLLK